MTAYEIEKSGIYDAARFAVTLKNGDVIELWKGGVKYNNGAYFKFWPETNILGACSYFDSEGWHGEIMINGEDIVNIKVLIKKEVENESKLSGYLLPVIGAIAFLVIFAAIGTGIEQLVKAIPWWFYIIIIAAFIFIPLLKSKDN